ncbi:MAG: hypothetical protein WDZ30_11120 [Cellvibrionaceae bacterium]
METSTYQSLKLIVLDLVDLSKDAIHIHIGLAVFFLTVALWRRGRLDWLSLLPVFLVASGLEFLDLRDDLASLGHMRWSASIHDLVNTVFWPTFVVILSVWAETRPGTADKDLRASVR